MRTAEEIEKKIVTLAGIKERAESTDYDIETMAMAQAAIMALKWALGDDDFDI